MYVRIEAESAPPDDLGAIALPCSVRSGGRASVAWSLSCHVPAWHSEHQVDVVALGSVATLVPLVPVTVTAVGRAVARERAVGHEDVATADVATDRAHAAHQFAACVLWCCAPPSSADGSGAVANAAVVRLADAVLSTATCSPRLAL